MGFIKKYGLKIVLWLPIVILVLNMSSVIFTGGYIIQMDVTEGTNIDGLIRRYVHTYNHDIGLSLAEKARIPIFFLIFSIYKATGLPEDYYIKIKILTLFISSFVAFTFFIKRIINKICEKTETDEVYADLAAIMGGIYYITNFWSANRLAHFLLFFSSVTIPITIYYMYKFLFEDGKVKNLIILLLFLAIFTATPHTILFEILIIGGLLIIYLLNIKRFDKRETITKTWLLLLFGILYFLTNLYWILPFIMTQAQPDAILTMSIVKIISRYANLKNSVRLMGYWLTLPTDYLSFEPTAAVTPKALNTLKQLITYIPLILTVIVLAVKSVKNEVKNKAFYYFLLLLLAAGTFLATASNTTHAFYEYLMFHSPIRKVGWLFREYDKFGLVLVFVYSVGLSLVIYLSRKNKVSLLLISILVTLTIGANAFFFQKKLMLEYSPQQIPSDFFTVTELLQKDPEMFNVIWYPGVPKPVWATTEEVRFVFSNKISPKPALTVHSSIINYVNYIFKEETLYDIDLGKSLDLVGVKYLVLRKDGSIFANERLESALSLQENLEIIHTSPMLVVYKNNSFSGYSKVFNNRLVSNTGLEVTKQLTSENAFNQDTFIQNTDKLTGSFNGVSTVYINDNSISLDNAMGQFTNYMTFPVDYLVYKDDGNPGAWKLGSTENLNHAEIDFFFGNMGLEITQYDFQKGIAIAREGLQKTSDSKEESGIEMITQFSENSEEIKTDNNLLIYTPKVNEEAKYWTIARSNKFALEDSLALEVNFKTDIDSSYIPHFKLYFYDENFKTEGIEFIYPDERGAVNAVIKVPHKAKYADFSIWTTPPQKQTIFKLANFSIRDASSYTEPVKMSYKDKLTECKNSCHVYARLLRSRRGGTLKIEVEDNKYHVNTLLVGNPERPEKNDGFEWIKIGTADTLKRNPEISLTNVEGFNVVNAVLILNGNQHTNLENELSRVTLLDLENQQLLPPKQIMRVGTTEINPTKYKIELGSIAPEYKVLGISLPYDKSWVLKTPEGDEIQAQLINGYINGFYVDNLKDGTYYVMHKPMDYFILGALISSSCYALLLFSLIFVKDLSASKLKSRSHG